MSIQGLGNNQKDAIAAVVQSIIKNGGAYDIAEKFGHGEKVKKFLPMSQDASAKQSTQEQPQQATAQNDIEIHNKLVKKYKEKFPEKYKNLEQADSEFNKWKQSEIEKMKTKN